MKCAIKNLILLKVLLLKTLASYLSVGGIGAGLLICGPHCGLGIWGS